MTFVEAIDFNFKNRYKIKSIAVIQMNRRIKEKKSKRAIYNRFDIVEKVFKLAKSKFDWKQNIQRRIEENTV